MICVRCQRVEATGNLCAACQVEVEKEVEESLMAIAAQIEAIRKAEEKRLEEEKKGNA